MPLPEDRVALRDGPHAVARRPCGVAGWGSSFTVVLEGVTVLADGPYGVACPDRTA